MNRKSSRAIFFFSLSLALIGIIYFVYSGSSIQAASLSSEWKQASVPTNSADSEVVVPTTGSEASTDKKAETTATSAVKENEGKSSKSKETPKQTYRVESGQTLWEIAQKNSIGIQQLMNQNQLTSTVIFEGQELVIEK